jgi:hypothetical protein
MKTSREIQQMLVSELLARSENILGLKEKPLYYNKVLGDTSFLLAGLLNSLMTENEINDWGVQKWIDDCLLMDAQIHVDQIRFWGIVIWGIEGTTEQWTDPFYFEMELQEDEQTFSHFTFLFRDEEMTEITYSDFRMNREYWKIKDRNWKYVFRVKGESL